MFSPSRPECFTWLSLLITESIIIVTFNVVTIIIFMRNRSLRTRGKYLVINLAVADALSGGFSECMLFVHLGGRCDFWKYHLTGNWRKLSVAMELLFPVSSIAGIVAISLQQLHARHISSVSTSRDQEEGIRCSNCDCVDCSGIDIDIATSQN